MCNYEYNEIHDIQVSIEMALKYICVYYKCLSVHLVVHFNHISKTIEVIMKIHINMYLSPNSNFS